MGKDGQPRGNVHEFVAPAAPNKERGYRKKYARRVAWGAVPAIAAALAGCAASAPALPDIVRVPAASQLPPASSTTQSDYDNATLALGAVVDASVGDYGQADQALGAIKNKKIVIYATAAVDNAEASAALDAADTQQFSYTDENTVIQTVNKLRVRPVRTLARKALNFLFARQAIIDAGNLDLHDLGGNPTNEKEADADLNRITDPALRKEAQRGVTQALHMNSQAYDMASRFSTQAKKIEYAIEGDGTKQDNVLGAKDNVADGF